MITDQAFKGISFLNQRKVHVMVCDDIRTKFPHEDWTFRKPENLESAEAPPSFLGRCRACRER